MHPRRVSGIMKETSLQGGINMFDCLLYPGGKPKALTLSYDDGVFQDVRLAEILRRYGVKCTFNLNSGLDSAGSWEFQGALVRRLDRSEWEKAYRGHEIAVHTRTHPHLEDLSPKELCAELWRDRRELEAHFGRPVEGMALPYGSWNSEVLDVIRKLGFRYCRTTESTRRFDPPGDFLLWGATCRHSDPQLPALADRFLKTGRELALFYLWGHSYEFDGDQNWDVLERFLEKTACRPDTWYASNGEICAYLTAARRLLTGEGFLLNPTDTDLWVRAGGEALRVPAGEWMEL